MELKNKKIYAAPELELLYVAAEQGFAASPTGDIANPNEQSLEEDWWNPRG